MMTMRFRRLCGRIVSGTAQSSPRARLWITSPWSCGAWLGHSMTRYALNPAMPVLSRPDGVVQVGWDPRRAVLVRPPAGLTARALGELLHVLQSGATLADVQALADGVDKSAIADLVAALVGAGV